MTKGIDKRPITLTITPTGEGKLQHWEGGGLEFRALQILHDEGPTTVGEVEKKLGLDEHKARALCRHLTKEKGWALAQ